jgi:hypothetical protein
MIPQGRRTVFRGKAEQPGGVWTDAAGPVHHARRRPLQVRLMALGAVLNRG